MNLAPTENTDRALQDWGEAYKELCAHILQAVPEIKHVDLYYGQENLVDGDGNWMPFRAPAVFLEFNASSINDMGALAQQLDMEVTAHLYVETVQDTNEGSKGQRRALEFVGLMRKLHLALHHKEGKHFNALSRTAMRRVEAPPYVYMYAQTYRTLIIDHGAAPQYDFGLWEPPDAP